MSAAYIPDTGDIVWLNFIPQTGHEQAGWGSLCIPLTVIEGSPAYPVSLSQSAQNPAICPVLSLTQGSLLRSDLNINTTILLTACFRFISCHRVFTAIALGIQTCCVNTHSG